MTIIHFFLFNKKIKIILNVSCLELQIPLSKNFNRKLPSQNIISILLQKQVNTIFETIYYRFKNELNFQIKITVRISILGHKL